MYCLAASLSSLAGRQALSLSQLAQVADDMTIQFNHTILYAHDSEASAKFLGEMLGLPAPVKWGPFVVVKTEIGAGITCKISRLEIFV